MKNTFITTTIALAALALVVPIAAFAQSANTGIMPPGLANRMDTAQAWNFIQGTAISGVNQLQGHNNEQIILIPTPSAGNNGQVMAGFITVSSSKPISVAVAHYMSNTTAIPAEYGQPAYMGLTPAPNSTLITGTFVASNTTGGTYPFVGNVLVLLSPEGTKFSAVYSVAYLTGNGVQMNDFSGLGGQGGGPNNNMTTTGNMTAPTMPMANMTAG